MVKAANFMPSDAWKSWVGLRAGLTVDEAVAMLIFFASHKHLIDRMTPAVSVSCTEILSTLASLANSSRAAAVQTSSTGAVSASAPRTTSKKVETR